MSPPRSGTPKITFICQANICRSPMAVGILKKFIQDGVYRDKWIVDSGGTWTKTGRKMHPGTQKLLEEIDIDLSDHRSKEVTRELVVESDLLLTMEIGQAEALQLEYPDQAQKISPLSLLKGHKVDIADPVSGGEAEFRETFNLITNYLRGNENLLKKWISAGKIG